MKFRLSRRRQNRYEGLFREIRVKVKQLMKIMSDRNGKSVLCKATITGEVVEKVLKTSISGLVELNTIKNLTDSATVGAFCGSNAHAANIISAIFIVTGQDPT
ncbi:3-hydroxy-3-methylglutaryl-coenzyme A reductase 2 [Capsicum chinense]|nr:3-hydroxy-3-methylglutaryl-coenzyme A reductase 2 [Capsicum chinense]